MILVNLSRRRLGIIGLALCIGLLGSGSGHSGLLSPRGRSYGPTTPGGYAVRVVPHAITLSHSKPQPIHVQVENASGAPVDGVAVSFRPSEGTVTPETGKTQAGAVTGVFAAATGSDQPRTVTVTVAVEDVTVTVFIDIVPAVFGR